MEAVPRLHMLWFALKSSPEGTSFSNLKKYIAEFYQEDPEAYSRDVYALETLRNQAMYPAKDATGSSVMKRYYCQLHSLLNRFPQLSERTGIFTFVWKDLYQSNVSEVTDMRYELAAVLFNIAASHTQIGASVTRGDVDGMKQSCTHFQCAAWAFGELRERYAHVNGGGDFMTTELLVFMQQVSFAQAQECILEKSLIDNRKPNIVAKVTAQIVVYYGAALAALLTGGDDGPVSQVIESSVYKLWKKYVRFKISYLNCILYLYQGQHAEEQQKMGQRVTLYQAAWDKLEEARKESKGLPDQKEINESLIFTADVVEAKRKNAKNENEFIYHEAVPELTDISAVQGANLVNGISFNVTDPEVAGEDIFARLVPMQAHEASSMYSEEKAKMLRKYGSLIEEKDTELAAFMSSLTLDNLNISEEKANKIPQGIVDRCAALNANKSAIPDLIAAMSQLAEICTDVELNLQEISSILAAEETQEREFQAATGVKRAPNAHITELTREFQKYNEAHARAGESNDTLRKAMEMHVNNLKILARPLQEIQQSTPKLSTELNTAEIFRDVKLIVNKVNEMKAQRSQFHADLRIAVNSDDITTKVIAHGSNEGLQMLFDRELGKHERLTQLIDQNLLAQQNILTALTESYAKAAPVLKTLADVKHKRDTFFSSLAASYDVYEDLLAKSAKGLEFYKKLAGNVQKLLMRLKSARDVQSEERHQRMQNVQKTAPASSTLNAAKETVPTGLGTATSATPKLRDYLKAKNGASAGNDGGIAPLTGSQNTPYIPPIRPNPLGSENPTQAACVSNYYTTPQPTSAVQQTPTSTPSTAPNEPPPPYSLQQPQFYDPSAAGYTNPIYQQQQQHIAPPAYSMQASPNSQFMNMTADMSNMTIHGNYGGASVPQGNFSQQAQNYGSGNAQQVGVGGYQGVNSNQQVVGGHQQQFVGGHQQQFVGAAGYPVQSYSPATANMGMNLNAIAAGQQPTFQQPSMSSNNNNTGYGFQQHQSFQQPTMSNNNAVSGIAQQAPGVQQPSFQQPLNINNSTASMNGSVAGAQQQSSFQQPPVSNNNAASGVAAAAAAMAPNVYDAAAGYAQQFQQSMQAAYTQQQQQQVPQQQQQQLQQQQPTALPQQYPVQQQQQLPSQSMASSYASTQPLYVTTTTNDVMQPPAALQAPYVAPNAAMMPPPSNITPPLTAPTSNATSVSTNVERPQPAYSPYATTTKHPGYRFNPKTGTYEYDSGYLDSTPVNSQFYGQYTSPSLTLQMAQQGGSISNTTDSENASKLNVATGLDHPIISHVQPATAGAAAAATAAAPGASAEVAPPKSSGIEVSYYNAPYGYQSNGIALQQYSTNTAAPTATDALHSQPTNAALPQQQQQQQQPQPQEQPQQPQQPHYQMMTQHAIYMQSGRSQPITQTTKSVQYAQSPQQSPAGAAATPLAKPAATVKPAATAVTAKKSSNIDLLTDIDFSGVGLGGAPPMLPAPELQPVVVASPPISQAPSESPKASKPTKDEEKSKEEAITAASAASPPATLTLLPTLSSIPLQLSSPVDSPAARKSSFDNISLCSDLSSLDQTFDWDSVSINKDKQQAASLVSNDHVSTFALKPNDPFGDEKILKYFHKEVERYEKTIESLNVKMLNGSTPLSAKWKELQDLLAKENSKRTTSIARLFPEKNRSLDCLPYDHARVTLDKQTDNYINAAFIKNLGPGCPNFIIAQTPQQNTINDFWSMIWSQKARTVMCLHTPNELMDPFWPQTLENQMHFDDFSVKLVKVNSLTHCMEYILSLSMHGADAIIDLSLLQIKAWTKSLPSQVIGIARNALSVHQQRCLEFNTPASPLIMNCLTGSERSELIAIAICAILATQTKRPLLINVVDVWYRICSQRQNALRDIQTLEQSMQIILNHAHDVLNKRGIMTSYQMKIAPQVAVKEKEEIKDPLNELDPLWKLK